MTDIQIPRNGVVLVYDDAVNSVSFTLYDGGKLTTAESLPKDIRSALICKILRVLEHVNPVDATENPRYLPDEQEHLN